MIKIKFFLLLSISFLSATCTEDITGNSIVIKKSFLGETIRTKIYTGASVLKNNKGSYNFTIYAKVPIKKSIFKKIYKRKMSAQIPPTTCKNRYHDNNDYKIYEKNGIIIGNSSIRYQKWKCITIKEPYLHKGYIPRTRDREVKTKILTHVEHTSFKMTPSILITDTKDKYKLITLNIKIEGKNINKQPIPDIPFTLGKIKIPLDYKIKQPIFKLVKDNVILRFEAVSANKMTLCSHSQKIESILNEI